MDKLEKLTNDDLFMTELEAQKWDEWERKSIYNDGMIEGSEQSTINIIKSMLKKKISYEDISDITNKTKEEIKEIEKL